MTQPNLEFDTAAQKSCYQKVASYCDQLFGDDATASNEGPRFYLRHGTAHVTVRVDPWRGDEDSTITVGAWVIQNIKLSPPLLLYLLRENYGIGWGGFGIDADDDIFFEHTIVGSTCDKDELSNSIAAVQIYGDNYGKKIKAMWGGDTAYN